MEKTLRNNIKQGIKKSLNPAYRNSVLATQLVNAYVEHVEACIAEADKSGCTTFHVMDFPINNSGDYLGSSYVKINNKWAVVKEVGFQLFRW